MARLPILMYHDVIVGKGKDLVISVDRLEKQFEYLASNGYKCYHLKELLQLERLPQIKNIAITFDDAYISHLQLVFPLLKKYNLKATFFVALDFIGKKDFWDTSELDIMTLEQLRSLDTNIIELGYHSFNHEKNTQLSDEEIESDLRLCGEFVSDRQLSFSPVLAYPYGKFPREKVRNRMFNRILEQNGMQYGLRIGNRVNRFPFKNPYEIKRIDVKGEWSLLKFKHNVRFGKLF